MDYMEWYDVVSELRPHVVRIVTPECTGTGFLVSYAVQGSMCVIATAAHVVNRAHYWEQPIRLESPATGKTILIRPSERAIFIEETKDTAAIAFSHDDFPLPETPFDLAPEGKTLKIGNEIGWLGFPAISPTDLCFFSGRISAFHTQSDTYLVDGVAINGVSGGPAFWNGGNRITITGVVSAYIANRATGETLPGLSVVTNVQQFQELAKQFKSLDEAKEQESSPAVVEQSCESASPAPEVTPSL
ncbi:MAG: hypothetical protein A4E63_01690 [Syntrophorhabdus sp. PtaU1.Bin050]|nr:MAG: hypothetical protein A4E63_01690 [Syntrophorhabdus sp. PtaU1.Bin050]